MYTVDQFLEDVKAEATALKKHATSKELSKLNAQLLDPFDHHSCIYGLATGSCFSRRASELIYACCPRYFVNKLDEMDVISSHEKRTVIGATAFVNGTEISGVESPSDFHDHRDAMEMHFSSIEVYIASEDANITDLIAFLKDETQVLKL